MSILESFEQFAFSILPCDFRTAMTTIRAQGVAWKKDLKLEGPFHRDVRQLYCSADGPGNLPVAAVGVLLSEDVGPNGAYTLFVSNLPDGYSSMVYMLSRTVPGIHLSIEVSRSNVPFPRNAITGYESGTIRRVVYAMRDDDAWKYYEQGERLSFEDVTEYKRRRIKDRITSRTIADQLKKFGYGSLEREFWIENSSDAYLLMEPSFKRWTG